MARRKIREFDAKRLILENLPRFGYDSSSYRGILVRPETNIGELPMQYPWLRTQQLVVKPDQLFGKRKQYNLVLVDVDFARVQEFLHEHRHKPFTMGKATDTLTHFLIEPFIPHSEELYLAITSSRDYDSIHFSSQGGFNIEERWETMKEFSVPTLANLDVGQLRPQLPENALPFVQALFALYRAHHFTYLELNPFAFGTDGAIHLLDCVAQVDDCASFLHQEDWSGLELPRSFGNKAYPEEEFIASLDKDSGASLKLTVLNPQGRIWNILSGGGASIIFLDTITNAGFGHELANYGEYSGNPTTEESYQYARTILELLTREHYPPGKILLIGGAIANFTDVEKTFQGIIHALKEYAPKLREGNVAIFVRRGGPNYEKGLQLMGDAAAELNLSMEVYGPETALVQVVPRALSLFPPSHQS